MERERERAMAAVTMGGGGGGGAWTIMNPLDAKHSCLRLCLSDGGDGIVVIFVKGTWFTTCFNLSITDNLNAWTFNKEAEKREALRRQGHKEFREITEGDFLGEVTGSERVICHFYHREFYRCKIMDKHLKALAPCYIDTKFIKMDAENAPFFVAKLAVKTLPCVILFRNGIAVDRLVGFQDLGSKDDFSTKTLENLLIRKGILDAKKEDEDDDDDSVRFGSNRTVRSSAVYDSDSD